VRDFYVPDLIRNNAAGLYPEPLPVDALRVDFGRRKLRPAILRHELVTASATVAQAYPSPAARGQDRDGAPAMGGFTQTIINNTGQPIHTEERADGRGGQQQIMIIGEMVAQAMSQPGNAANRALAARGAVKPMVRR